MTWDVRNLVLTTRLSNSRAGFSFRNGVSILYGRGLQCLELGLRYEGPCVQTGGLGGMDLELWDLKTVVCEEYIRERMVR